MILVTGGTGFVGTEVVRSLLAAGYRVRLLVRDPRRAAAWAYRRQVEIVRGDALRPDTLPPALADVQTVIHLIGIIAETPKVGFEQAHEEATRNVLAAARAAGVTRWIQMSAAGTRPGAASRYHQTKWAAEERVRASGLDWTIFRPSLIYGHDERDRLLNLLISALSPPWVGLSFHSFPLLEAGRLLVQPVAVREVAQAFAQAVAEPASMGKTYDLVGPVAFSWRQMIGKIATHLERKVTYEEFPLLLLLRGALGIAVLVLPVLLVVGVVAEWVSLAQAEIGAGLWCGLLLLACRLRQIVLFSIPSAPLLLLARVMQRVAPRWLQFGEQLKMALEDNVGDPRPAAEVFAYTPESFEQGLQNLRPNQRTKK